VLLRNWLQDLKTIWHGNPNRHGIICKYGGKDCWVGSGWLAVYIKIRQYIVGNLTVLGCFPWRDNVTLTGHSLGAALAQLAMLDLNGQGFRIVTSYVFGSPRVGDTTWANAFETRIGLGTVYHVTLRHDPVPRLPPRATGYVHASTEVFYKGNTSEGYTICAAPTEDPRCIDSSGNTIRLIKQCLKGDCDHLKYMTPEKTILMSGASCTTRVDKSSIWV